jgi:anti-sigma factor RsiW
MAKRLKKGEKLDLILGELSKLKAEVAKLTKQQNALLSEIASLKTRAAPKRAAPKPQPKSTPAAKPGKLAQARKIPVLVQSGGPPQSASGGS